MTEPLVCAVMLTRDRPEMAAAAIERFNAQTYERKILVIVYSGSVFPVPFWKLTEFEGIRLFPVNPHVIKTIGELRNFANSVASALGADIIVHWDDDDWSHEDRIRFQVQHLIDCPRVDAVGYREMLFWRTQLNQLAPGSSYRDSEPVKLIPDDAHGEAWLYRNNDRMYALGSSLCYWRTAWDRVRFENLPLKRGGLGEDTAWLRRVSSFGRPCEALVDGLTEPMMICRIHGGNTQDYSYELLEASSSWTRRPDWDEYCRTTLSPRPPAKEVFERDNRMADEADA